MKKVKVGMIQINNSFSGQNYLPLSLGFLQSYALMHAKEIENFRFLNPIYKRVKVADAVSQFEGVDIAAFSVYVWNHKLSLEIARELKRSNPKCLIIFGGCHIPDKNTDEYLLENDFVDIAAVGEGERVFCSLLDNYPKRSWDLVPSITYRDGHGKVVSNPQADRIKDMNEIPSPFLEGYFDNLIQNNPKERWIGLWETNRGCPFSCTFCDWGVGFKKKVQKYSLEDRLFLEADWFTQNKIEFIFCCDANFGMYKERDYAIAKRFADNKRDHGYPHALSVQNTKNNSESSYEVQKLLSDSGLSKGALIAFQSMHVPTLKAIKRGNIKLSHFIELQKRFTDDGVKTFSDMILGLPEETYKSFSEGACQLIEMGQHNRIQFNNLSILPNTEMAAPEYIEKYGLDLVENEIINIHGKLESEEIAEVQQMVVATKSMPDEEWVKTRAFGYMVGFLHFNKIFQIPLIIANSIFGIKYEKIFDAFLSCDGKKYPAILKIKDGFFEHARKMQDGGFEFIPSKKWLNIWWPPDELAFIDVVTNGDIDMFYENAKEILNNLLQESGVEQYEEIITQAVQLNKSLIKLPKQKNDLKVTLKFNIWDVYDNIMKGKKATLLRGIYEHSIDRTSEKWESWEEWCEKVVWWCNKKGAYLYECITKDDKIVIESKEVKGEPFGNDTRYQ